MVRMTIKDVHVYLPDKGYWRPHLGEEAGPERLHGYTSCLDEGVELVLLNRQKG